MQDLAVFVEVDLKTFSHPTWTANNTITADYPPGRFMVFRGKISN